MTTLFSVCRPYPLGKPDPVFLPATPSIVQTWARGASFIIVLWFFLLAPAYPPLHPTPSATSQETRESTRRPPVDERATTATREALVAGYVGNPIYYRSDFRFTREDNTDIELLGLGWDGDALRFPIDGGVRFVRWRDDLGFMIDFLHNKAIARLGKGAHGRKLSRAVVEEVQASGMLAGAPAPARIRLTEIFDRLEFTHGHNMLFFTGMKRLQSPSTWAKPYVGVGAGVATPHVEVWFRGEEKARRTNEYQYAGPTAQLLAGIEFQIGRGAYFIEYKFNYAWLDGALTADESWKNWNLPGDLWRQFNRWRRGEEPSRGRFSTTLGAHQIVAGAGYRWHPGAK